MNRIKLVQCPTCNARPSDDCRTGGHVRKNPITGKAMFHRARIERAVREVGLVAARPQPPQLRRDILSLIEGS